MSHLKENLYKKILKLFQGDWNCIGPTGNLHARVIPSKTFHMAKQAW